MKKKIISSIFIGTLVSMFLVPFLGFVGQSHAQLEFDADTTLGDQSIDTTSSGPDSTFNTDTSNDFQPVDFNGDGQIESGSSGSSNTACFKRAPQNIGELFEFTLCLMQGAVIPFLVGLGVLLFIVGVLRYVSAGDNEEKREGGRDLMIFGIIALFVMISVWGFVRILHNTFFSGSAFELPSLPKRAKSVFQES